MNNFEGTMGMSLSTKISSLKEKIDKQSNSLQNAIKIEDLQPEKPQFQSFRP